MKNQFYAILLALTFVMPTFFSGTLHAAEGKSAMVATADPRASSVALQILKRGGTAADAAIAAQWVLNVVEPQSSGIGGGGFFLYYEAETKRVYTFDGREKAPLEAYPEMFLDETNKPYPFYPDRITGGLPVGVPGTLMLLKSVHDRFGSKYFTFSELFDPAIHFAKNGFQVSERLAHHIDKEKKRLELFKDSRETFLDKKGEAIKPKSILVQSDLAETFQLIQKKGIDVFYSGEIAQDIAYAVRQSPYHPGVLKEEDLKSYRVVERSPLRGHYRGYDIYGMGPPSSGGSTLIEALHILENFEVATKGYSLEGAHLLNEAQKLAFQDRNRYLGDPSYSKIPIKDLVAKEFGKMRSEAIVVDRVIAADPAKTFAPFYEGQHTSHISIVDAYGNMVSFTTTIESVFGSALMVPGRGFILNNELTDFNELPVKEEGGLHPNAPESEKRPRSSMSPTFVFRDGKPILIAGTPGGSTIIGTVFNIIVNVIDFDMPLLKAISFPRMINRDGSVEMESQLYYEMGLKTKLEKMGHSVEHRPVIGNAQVIYFDHEKDKILGESDPRGEGRAFGY